MDNGVGKYYEEHKENDSDETRNESKFVYSIKPVKKAEKYNRWSGNEENWDKDWNQFIGNYPE